MKILFMLLLFLLLNQAVYTQVYSVTFQVDMNAQIEYGMFDPAQSGVMLRGSFNDWTDQEPMNDNNSDGIYILTKELEAGSIAHKYFFINTQGQSNWEEISDRLTDVSADTVLPVVFFNNDPGNKTVIDVNFKVNMEIESISGRFDVNSGIVTARGNFNGWEGTDTCTADFLDPFNYSKIVKVLGELGDVIHYKFNVNDDRWEVDFPENDGGHRLIEITQEHIDNQFAEDPFVYPSEYFDGLDPNMLTGQQTTITFVVDMNDATDLNGNPFPAIENVFLCGDVSPLYWAWNSEDVDQAIFMYDDGTNGDETAEDDFWTVKVIFPQFTTTYPFSYKFGANFDLPSNNGINDNENYPGDDHYIQLTQNLISGTVRNTFGSATTADDPHQLEEIVTELEDDEITPVEYKLFQNYPNPFNPSTVIKFTLAENSNVSLKIFDVLGNEVLEMVNNNLDAGTYNFKFDSKRSGSKLASGIYIAQLTANDFNSTIKMLLMK
ncbi:MAG: T9SS type A sorting domain-containing protein [Candidatus Cloacimonetes bacterium]|nr:T9SS type A sorting domain-containing protein [Candidatus Cloacimonadota bacterium]